MDIETQVLDIEAGCGGPVYVLYIDLLYAGLDGFFLLFLDGSWMDDFLRQVFYWSMAYTKIDGVYEAARCRHNGGKGKWKKKKLLIERQVHLAAHRDG